MTFIVSDEEVYFEFNKLGHLTTNKVGLYFANT